MNNSETVNEYRQYLAELSALIKNPTAGFFGPESIAWQVNREGVLGLGALRALLLQVAHPKVAQGVAEHSRYATNPFERAYSTLRAQQTIVFGSCEEASEVLVKMYARHAVVKNAHGHQEEYSGNDPNLQLWVLGTLVDTIFRMHPLFLNPLTKNEQDQFYREIKLFGQLMGIPLDVMPPSLREFEFWMDEMIASDEIRITSEAHSIAASLLRLPAPIFYPANFILAGGMLPEKIREQYGLQWSPVMEKLYQTGIASVKLVASILPMRLRTTPPYWHAMARVATV